MFLLFGYVIITIKNKKNTHAFDPSTKLLDNLCKAHAQARPSDL